MEKKKGRKKEVTCGHQKCHVIYPGWPVIGGCVVLKILQPFKGKAHASHYICVNISQVLLLSNVCVFSGAFIKLKRVCKPLNTACVQSVENSLWIDTVLKKKKIPRKCWWACAVKGGRQYLVSLNRAFLIRHGLHMTGVSLHPVSDECACICTLQSLCDLGYVSLTTWVHTLDVSYTVAVVLKGYNCLEWIR